ncbi:MAG: response regulator transcription factor [Gammaproteobacteria bacterium]|nr:response regulator transcription factor [Gammaproteobacteria bacterium]NNM20074.1 response regulator transcription factor [Gammaproteobacteria bacterium]
MRILLVEDEQQYYGPLLEALVGECYAVDHAADGHSADELYFVNDYDLVILDWIVPSPTGMELLWHWREKGHETPILMLTDHPEVEDLVCALDAGADDCLAKPFVMAEFLARVRSLLRRRSKPLPRLTVDNIQMNRAAHRVTLDDGEIQLSPKEFAILEYLLARPGEVVSRTELIEHVWDDTFDSINNVVDVAIHRLRAKIDGGRARPLLRTVRGVGYSLGRVAGQ